jgi:integrase
MFAHGHNHSDQFAFDLWDNLWDRKEVGVMARQISKLTAISIPRIKEPGLHPDGNGLYLRVKVDGRKTWVFRFMLHGKAREMGLGALNALSLADARSKAAACRKQISEGIDPIAARDAATAKAQLEAARVQTFRQCAEAYIEANKPGWRNAKHAAQWETSLETYAYPIIGHLAVQDVDVTLVLKVLEQKKPKWEGKKFWEATPETANRIRNRMECVLDWANAREYRRGENPARWRGHLENLLPSKRKLKGVKHHAALPYDEVCDFLKALRQQQGMGVDAFEFLILTAARTSEVTGARWREFDLKKNVWTIPAERIKGGREHRVPLSTRALEILKQLPFSENKDGFVFPGRNIHKPLSKMGLISILNRMGRRDITVHGFRSSFRDWAAEQTHYPREIVEIALAHVSGDRVELAYRRSDLFEKRQKLMDAWARYCLTPKTEKEAGKILKIGQQ